jgi:hypothetical protein
MRRPKYISRFTFYLTYTHRLTDLSEFKESVTMQNLKTLHLMAVLLFTPRSVGQLTLALLRALKVVKF